MCVYTKTLLQIDPVMLLRSITQSVTAQAAKTDGRFLLAVYLEHVGI